MKLKIINTINISAIVVLTALDQLFKMMADRHLPKHDAVTAIGGILDFRYIENYGAAFGMFSGMRWILIGLTSVFIAAGMALLVLNKIKGAFLQSSAVLIIAGGLGNLINRIFDGYVVDYLQFTFWPFQNFAIFNFADCLVVIGTAMMFAKLIIYDAIKGKKNGG
ncbi:MAG: signal peptidase II [Oscillospiraceae bacterium]|nr:signal peptidase II [Oscillospiraceae bacterium]